LAVFVEHKSLESDVALPPVRFEAAGQAFEVQPDVVALGHRPATMHGRLTRFSGLHAGAGIRVEVGRGVTGGVACLLGQAGKPSHLVTAGHLFESGKPAEVSAALSTHAPPRVIGKLESNLLDEDESHPYDVALVRLNAAGVAMVIGSGTHPRLPRLDATPFDAAYVGAAKFRAFLPLRGDYVANLDAEYRFNTFYLNSPLRGEYRVRNVVTTRFADNIEGNSGTVLMTDDPTGQVQGQATGVVVGYAGLNSLHEPLDRALRRISERAGTSFEIWSQS
jgi:hypothetical protein